MRGGVVGKRMLCNRLDFPYFLYVEKGQVLLLTSESF